MILVATHIPTGATTHFDLREGRFGLGRATDEDPEKKLAVPFDPKLSRRLAWLTLNDGTVLVERDQSRSPIFHEGDEKARFTLAPGQRFSSGETVFELFEGLARTLTVRDIEEIRHGSPERILQILLDLQDFLSRWHETTQLWEGAVALLGELLPEAEASFFDISAGDLPVPLVTTTLRPSRSLLAECLGQKAPVYHLWSPGTDQPTRSNDEQWALAAPILSSVDRVVLYAVGRQSENRPGELERGALSLVAQTLGQHLEGRRSLFLAARVEAEAATNRNLSLLLETVKRSVSLQKNEVIEEAVLDSARRLTGADRAKFSPDLSAFLGERRSRIERTAKGYSLGMVFERARPQGILCSNPPDRPFETEHEGWLGALMGFAETLLENRRLHREVNAALAQLSESQDQLVRSSQWAAAGRLAANAAHELNTPVGAIKLSTETAMAFLEQGPALESLRLVLRSVDRCRGVTERLLTYSRPQNRKTREVISLAAVVEDSLSSVSPFLKSKSIQADCRVEEQQVVGDLQDCYWAITNVLQNAADALEPGGQLRLTSSLSDGMVVLLVEDSGPGVPGDLSERIFEPFFSTKKIGRGNGLGLTIGREALRAWGGDLTLEKSGLGGAGFALHLPAAGSQALAQE